MARREPVKLHFETVPVEQVIARLKNRGAVAPRDGADRMLHFRSRKTDPRSRAGKHILSISYDVALLHSRKMLLEEHGYSVSSVVGLAGAIEACRSGNFDLIILGHSIPTPHRRTMLDQIRAACRTPVLALQRMGDADGAAGDADHTFNPIEGPRAFLAAVDRILGSD